MRLYVSIIAAAAALTTTACGKKAEKPPEAKPAEVAKPEEKKPEEKKPEEAKPVEAKVEEKKPEEAKPAEVKPEEAKVEEKKGPADRTAAIQAGFEAASAGKMADFFANFTDDAVWYDVGMPAEEGETKGREAILADAAEMGKAFSDVKMKASRIIEAGEFQVVEYVWTGKNTAPVAEGAPATNKDVSLMAGLVLHYNAAGLIDKAWSFRDGGSLAMQLGAMPGLPADFVAAKLPETTEVVKGEFNPALKDLFTAFGAKLKADTIDAAIDESYADDFTMVDDMSGKTITGKQAAKDVMHGWMKMFQVDSMSSEQIFGAGDYLVSVSTTNMTYKGGIEGIEAKDQKIASHSLMIAKYTNGKLANWAEYGNKLEVMTALMPAAGAAEKPAEGAPAGEVPSFGVAACDTFVKAMTACAEKVPAAGKDGITKALQGSVDAFKQAAAMGEAGKAALEQSCGAALSAAKQGMSTLCPDVKWE